MKYKGAATMQKITVAELRSQTPSGYNLAVIVDPDTPVTDLEMFRDACIVMSEADGPLGVIRAMDFPGRRQGIQRQLAAERLPKKLLHLKFWDHGATLDVCTFTLHKD
jgi:hypothetical protein